MSDATTFFVQGFIDGATGVILLYMLAEAFGWRRK